MSKIHFHRSVLASALALALFGPQAFAQPASSGGDRPPAQAASDAQTAGTQAASKADKNKADKNKAVKLKAVTVTGSMIPRVEVEGATPVLTITGAQIKQQGFTTMWEFLDSLPQVGPQTQDPSSWGATAVNARPLNLRNLGPGFSLLLIDGHRVVDYPQPLYGQSNFQNYSNILPA